MLTFVALKTKKAVLKHAAALRHDGAKLGLETGALLCRAEELQLPATAVAEALGVSYKTALGAKAAYRYVAAAKVSTAEIEEIGLYKIAILATRTPPAHWPVWRKKARAHTSLELKDMLSGRTLGRKQYVFVFAPAERARLDDILRIAGARQDSRGVLGREDAMLRIAEEWLAVVSGGAKKAAKTA